MSFKSIVAEKNLAMAARQLVVHMIGHLVAEVGRTKWVPRAH